MAGGIARVFSLGDEGYALQPPLDSTLNPSILAEGGPAMGQVHIKDL